MQLDHNFFKHGLLVVPPFVTEQKIHPGVLGRTKVATDDFESNTEIIIQPLRDRTDNTQKIMFRVTAVACDLVNMSDKDVVENFATPIKKQYLIKDKQMWFWNPLNKVPIELNFKDDKSWDKLKAGLKLTANRTATQADLALITSCTDHILPANSTISTILVLTKEEEDNLFIYDEYYEPSNEPLFSTSNSPNIEEIKQRNIGNCAFLAVIEAILTHPFGKYYLYTIMKQHSNGTTSVCLTDPETKKPIFLVVPSVKLVKKNNRPLAGGLWVEVLLNAYAAFGRTARMELVGGDAYIKTSQIAAITKVEPAISRVFRTGSDNAFVSRVLTNSEKTKALILNKESVFLENRLNFWEMEENETVAIKEKKIQQIGEILSLEDHCFKNVLTENIKNNATKAYEDFCYFYKKNEETCQAILACATSDKEKLEKLCGVIKDTNDDVLQLLNKTLLFYSPYPVNKKGLFALVQSEQQQRVFSELIEATASGKLIVASTYNKFEKDVPGLLDDHAYGNFILSYRIEKIFYPFTQEEIMLTFPCVQFRNPWGHYNRCYKFQGKKITYVKTEDSLSELELTEFINHFKYICLSDSVNSLFQHRAKWVECVSMGFGKKLKVSEGFNFQNLVEDIRSFEKEYPSYPSTSVSEYVIEQMDLFVDFELFNIQALPLTDEETQTIKNTFNKNLPSSEEEEKVHSILLQQFSDKDIRQQIYRLLKLTWLKSLEAPSQRVKGEIEVLTLSIALNIYCPFSTQKKALLTREVKNYCDNYLSKEIQNLETQTKDLLISLNKNSFIFIDFQKDLWQFLSIKAKFHFFHKQLVFLGAPAKYINLSLIEEPTPKIFDTVKKHLTLQHELFSNLMQAFNHALVSTKQELNNPNISLEDICCISEIVEHIIEKPWLKTKVPAKPIESLINSIKDIENFLTNLIPKKPTAKLYGLFSKSSPKTNNLRVSGNVLT